MSKKKQKSSPLLFKIKTVIPIIIGTLAADQLTKLIILYTLTKHQIVYICSVFNFTLTYNTGVSFGMFQSNGMLGFWLLILMATGLCGYLTHLVIQTKDRFEEISFSLIIGGAIGNILDRFFYGGVVDFLQFHLKQYYWPTFNIADSAIVIGVILVLGSQTWHSLKNIIKKGK
ncbi:MAG: signal peptidase II [Candidatus Paracaedibacteraceae bacterium]|nr:signal peptidase II [Candidatus Paracaedibacteraceae bacterium]